MADRGLGCGAYTAFITDVGGVNRLAQLAITQVEWGRRLDEVSEARVTLAAGQDAKCLLTLQNLEPFNHELQLYRDSVEAWVGPVTEPTFTHNDTTILARDLFQWFERRLLPYDRTFIGTDLAIIAAQYMTDALAIDTSPNVSFTVNPCGVTGDRTVLGITYRRCADEVREIARGGLDWTTVGRRILFGGSEVSAPRLPSLTESMFEIQSYRLAGLAKANHVIVLGATPPGVTTPLVGEAGGLDTPVVEMTVQEPSILDVPSATAAAGSRWEFWHTAPQYVTGRFLETAPFTIDRLVPGVLARIRQQVGHRYIDATFRLVEVKGSGSGAESGATETLLGMFEPVGSSSETG